MNALQKEAQVEMLLHRVVYAEAALKTIAEHSWRIDETKHLAKRALESCHAVLDKYTAQYPD